MLAPFSVDRKINNKNDSYFYTTTLEVKAQNLDPINLGGEKISGNEQKELELGCFTLTDFSIATCVSSFLYHVVFQIISTFATFAAKFLDFFVYYSTNSSSYSNEFVANAWGIVRDIVNIFFIVSLVYIGIMTILGIHASENKKMVGMVVLIALVINFSLFTTKIVIDASNIMAKVFYNNITPQNENGDLLVAGAGGQKSISVGLIQKYNPQRLITQDVYNQNKGMFMFLLLLFILITGYTGYIFFSVALLFLARVISLWLSMILSPLAFITYALPFHLPGFDHKKWWTELLQNAFLAPIFIFFLYIIILFTGSIQNIISYPESAAGIAGIMQTMMAVTIPFLIIVGLLQRAKKLAVEYSGEIGATINKYGAMAGGAILGTAGGAAGLALSGTLGKLASKVVGGEVGMLGKGGERLRELATQKGLAGTIGKYTLRTLDRGAGASFDVRKSYLGKLAAKGGLDLEKGTERLGLAGASTAGGYKAIVAKKQAPREKEFETYKTRMSDAEVKAMYADKTADYERRKKQAQETYGNKFDEKAFAAANPRPPQTAEELDIMRKKEFMSNLGKTGIMYEVAYRVAKAQLGAGASEDVVDNRARNIRLGIGTAGMALATGGIGGLAGLGALGVAGATAAGAVGGFAKSATYIDAELAARSKIKRDIEKQEKTLDKVR
ncbi:MAG: hypothetical protein AAB873_02545, partial [Patescibacteria group bacterium]